MNTARIVVLTIAVGAVSGVATNSARGAVSSGLASAGPAAHLLGSTSSNGEPLSLALNAVTGSDILQSNARDDRAFRRGDNTKVATQK
jgi:hypothetical protein